MSRLRAASILLALAAAAALGLSACGGSSSELLPGKTADEINSNLDQVRVLVNEGDCAGAEDAVGQVGEEVDALSGVDKKLKAALQEGTARLGELVSSCEIEAAAAQEKEFAEQEEAEQEEQAAVETEEEAETKAEEEKAKKQKPKQEAAEEKQQRKEQEQAEREEEETAEAPTESEGVEKGNGPPAETPSGNEPPAGGVGPGVGVE